MAKLIVKGASLVWDGKPGRGGHAMYVLQWLEGLRRLGHDVLYYDQAKESTSPTIFQQAIERWWNPHRSALVLPDGRAAFGLDAGRVERFAREAAGIITLACPHKREPEPWLAHARPRVLIDQDPGFSQMWASEGDPTDVFGTHDVHFTVGAHIGAPKCGVESYGIDWKPIWNPVVLDWWPFVPVPDNACFTTIAGWWLFGYQAYQGQLWGPKAEQFGRFSALPRLVGEPLEIALETSEDDPDVTFFAENGWRIVSPIHAAADADAYRNYILGSAGEFSCAKGLYVGTRCGWFSDRSECYLAAHRPVVVQGTGFEDVLPTGKGLFSVDSVDEAVAAIRAIRGDYFRHSAAAREIASEYFDSRRVLSSLLREIGL